MPIQLSPQQTQAALEAGGSDLKYLLAREQVGEDIQAKFYHIGITTIPKFATFASDVTEFKEILKTEFELDGSSKPKHT